MAIGIVRYAEGGISKRSARNVPRVRYLSVLDVYNNTNINTLVNMSCHIDVIDSRRKASTGVWRKPRALGKLPSTARTFKQSLCSYT